MAEQENTYIRRSGVDAWRGHNFEWGLTVLVYLRCQRLHEEWKKDNNKGIKSFSVANNVDGAGNCDDVVVRVEYVDNGDIKNKTIFVQCKHISSAKEKKKMDLFSQKAIKDYADSFSKIHLSKNQLENRHTVRTESQNLQAAPEANLLCRFLNCDDLDIDFLLYSNIGLDKDYNLEGYQLKYHKIVSDITCMLFYTSGRELFEYRLQKQTNVDELFSYKFRIFLSQSDELETFIDKEIKSLPNTSVDVMSLRELIFQELKLHFTMENPCNALTEKADLFRGIRNFMELNKKGTAIIDNFCQNFGLKDIFSSQVIDDVQKLFTSENQDIIRIETKFQKLERIKFLQMLCTHHTEFTCFFINHKYEIEKWIVSRDTKTYQRIKKVYIFCNNIEFPTNIKKGMNENVIQIVKSGEERVKLLEWPYEFTTEMENLIQDTKICFQGESTDVKSFCGGKWKMEFFENTICIILKNNLLEIDRPLPILDFYIPRSFIKVNLSPEFYKERGKTWSINDDCLILFSEEDRCIHNHNSNYKTFENMEDFGKFVPEFDREDNEIYHLCYYNGGQVERLYSFGTASDFTKVKRIDEDFLLNETRAKISVISAVAGMGKTTTLLALARSYKQKNPSHWVFFIELNNHLQQLRKLKYFDQFPSKLSAVKFISTTVLNLNGIELALFTDACNESGNSALFFDAFDEISPDAEETFLLLLKELIKTKICKIFISSRPNYTCGLEKELFCTRIEFLGLESDEKKYALEGFWNQMLKKDGKTIEKKILKETVQNSFKLLRLQEDLLNEMLAIPLQIRMLAFIYYESLSIIATGQGVPHFPEMNLAELYENFINMHAKRFFIEKMNLGWDNLKDTQTCNLIIEKLKGAEELGFSTIFPNLISNDMDLSSTSALSLCDEVGIIKSRNPVAFIHRTVAEYLAAKYIVRKILCHSTYHDYSENIISILTDKKLNTVRKFLNFLLIDITAEKLGEYKIGEEKTETDDTTFHVASLEGNDQILRFLLLRNTCLLNKQNLKGQSPLFIACNNGNTNVVKLLLSHNNCIVDTCDKNGDTVLHIAIRKNYVEIIQHILNCGKPPINIKNVNNGFTPLLEACYYGKTEAFNLLFKQENYLEHTCTTEEETILHLAASAGYTKIIKLILQRDNRLLNKTNKKGCTPLHCACFNSQTESVKLLLTHKDCSINTCDSDGNTALHYASNCCSIEILHALLQRLQRGDTLLSQKNNKGYTPLHEACGHGKIEAVNLLLTQTDCPVNICDNDGDTVLHYLSLGGNIKLMQLILDRDKALLNMQNNSGHTPLHKACDNGQTKEVKFFLDQFVSLGLTIDNDDLKKALDLAKIRGYGKIIELLQQHGGKNSS